MSDNNATHRGGGSALARVAITDHRPGSARLGLSIAGVTALVSGISVFVNSYGVHAVRQPAVYTTAKNLVAALLIASGTLLWRRRPAVPAGSAPFAGLRGLPPLQWARLAYVGVVGGGVAFVLFFVGLAHTTAEPAAFLHDTLVLWVALLAVWFLGERLSPWNVAAVALLISGQVAVTGGVGHLVVSRGQALVLAATILWAVETVVAKRLLASLSPAVVANARMAIGAGVLVVYLALTGDLGTLLRLDAAQLGWTALTGLLLTAYVITWMEALARARAVDVASVLVASVVVTSLLDAAAGHHGLAPQALGLVLVALGAAAVMVAWPRPVAPSRPEVP
jgi:drug/metabolite transporter (DMT)-like permease